MKICTWGDVASSLEGKPSGGGELQIALLMKALAKAGHEVVIVDYLTRNDYVTTEGIKVFQIKGYNNGISGLRFFTHRLPGIYSNLKAQKADIYYCQIRDFRHILAYLAARKVKGKFVLQLASDLDAKDLKMRLKHDYLTHFGGLYWFAKLFLVELIFPMLVRKADIILVQHKGQKDDLMKKGIQSIIFYNLIEFDKIPALSDPERQEFSYVGALDNRKGFFDFFRLVEKAPFAKFKIIGKPRDRTGNKYFRKLKSYGNVTLYGMLSHSDTMFQIQNSKALISTSPMEGFPNIFVEAWACGTPVLSLYFDPGGIIRNVGLGEVADGSIDKLIDLMTSLKNTPEFENKAKAYIEQNHVLNKARIKEITTLFNKIRQSANPME